MTVRADSGAKAYRRAAATEAEFLERILPNVQPWERCYCTHPWYIHFPPHIEHDTHSRVCPCRVFEFPADVTPSGPPAG